MGVFSVKAVDFWSFISLFIHIKCEELGLINPGKVLQPAVTVRILIVSTAVILHRAKAYRKSAVLCVIIIIFTLQQTYGALLPAEKDWLSSGL